MSVLEFFVKMVEHVEMKSVDTPVNALLHIVAQIVNMVCGVLAVINWWVGVYKCSQNRYSVKCLLSFIHFMVESFHARVF